MPYMMLFLGAMLFVMGVSEIKVDVLVLLFRYLFFMFL
ncbi:DUF3953 domain-containing protein [Bacillus sp. YZJH907-2]|uniref:DUF3953 domain-containing protein n=1 Tax=Halalkalibacter suaedae TaxID=2822140 RepID=A0A940WZ66_9BACI|nr:DUF3953 domain-containing protein [Bacillus suaedae]